MLSITRGRHKRKPHLRNPQHQPIEGIWPSEQSFASSRVFVVDVGIHEVVLSVTRPIRWLHGALHGHVRDIVRYQGGLYIQDSVQRARVHLDVVSVWMQNGHSLASIGSIQQRSCPPARSQVRQWSVHQKQHDARGRSQHHGIFEWLSGRCFFRLCSKRPALWCLCSGAYVRLCSAGVIYAIVWLYLRRVTSVGPWAITTLAHAKKILSAGSLPATRSPTSATSPSWSGCCLWSSLCLSWSPWQSSGCWSTFSCSEGKRPNSARESTRGETSCPKRHWRTTWFRATTWRKASTTWAPTRRRGAGITRSGLTWWKRCLSKMGESFFCELVDGESEQQIFEFTTGFVVNRVKE